MIVGNFEYCAQCKEIDFLKKFTEYVSIPVKNNGISSLGNTSSDISSELESLFGAKLKDANISAIAQYSAAGFLLDFAIVYNDHSKLDIEIDGEMYHKEWNGETVIQDIIRDNILEVNGWNIMRFWSYEILDTPEKCIDKVKLWISNHCISE